jgi:hypothetical protein
MDGPQCYGRRGGFAHSAAGAVRYYAGKCGPGFACGSNNKLPCAWGAVKVMQAFSRWPLARRTPLIERAMRQGVDFLLSTDPAVADYPAGYSDKPSGNWWKFGFSLFYVTDLLQNVEVLVSLGYGRDPRLANALAIGTSKMGRDAGCLLKNLVGSSFAGRGYLSATGLGRILIQRYGQEGKVE